ncbi:MAG: hypothetical protein CML03_07510 [Pseudooceanicola sp.]|nr:hypothetical protein [Pseudooceanicola sp.]
MLSKSFFISIEVSTHLFVMEQGFLFVKGVALIQLIEKTTKIIGSTTSSTDAKYIFYTHFKQYFK